MIKQQRLDKISKEIAKCKLCKAGKFGKAVPGEGDPDAQIIFIGEAPGRKESETGKPFIGRSGKLLTTLIESSGLKREDLFITSPVKYYPGKRAPNKLEIEHGKIHLQKQIEIIKPKLIVLLGKVAAKAVISRDLMISNTHGQTIRKNQKDHYITFHPASALRFPRVKKLIVADFQKLRHLTSKPQVMLPSKARKQGNTRH